MRCLLSPLLLVLGLSLFAQSAPPLPRFTSGLLLEPVSGRILWEKNPEQALVPASLTKMVTLHLAWKALESRQVARDQKFPIPREGSAGSQPPGSSLMFLEEGLEVRFWDLMVGTATVSGNDAATTLALILAPTVEDFVRQMNEEMQALGFSTLRFYDPAGLDPRNRITPREYGEFLRIYLKSHPSSLETLHSLPRFTFPTPDYPEAHSRPITQKNRNSLVGSYPGADGLKTGYLPQGGYHIAATAQRGNFRLLTLVLGVQAGSTAEGTRLRAQGAERLLDWGFENFTLVPSPMLPPGPRQYYAARPKVDLEPSPPPFPLSAGEKSALQVTYDLPKAVLGPVKAGTVLGWELWTVKGKLIRKVPLTAQSGGEPAPWWVALAHWFELLFAAWTGEKPPFDPSTPGFSRE